MKKTYMNPDIQVIKIQTANMIATSGPDVVNGGETNQVGDLLGREDDGEWED